MTVRAVIIGMLGAVSICGFGFFNDRVIRQTFITGNHMPIFVYGMLVVFLLAGNPALRRVWRRAALTAREIAVILAIILPACYVPGRGFIHIFTSVVMMPRHHERTIPGWKKYDIVRMAPAVMLAGTEPEFTGGDILHADAVRKGLAGAPDAPPAVERVRMHLPEDARARLQLARPRLEEASAAPDTEPSRTAVALALNRLLDVEDIYEEIAFPASGLSLEATELLERRRDGLAPGELRRFNRHLMDSAFAGDVRSLSSREERAVRGFVQGLGEGAGHISVSDVPWYAWKRTLSLFWLPMVVCLSAGCIGLALVVHKQWSEHEHLPYPIVTFANALLPEEGRSRGSVFRDRSFLIAGGAILLLHMNNYAYEWWPKTVAQIPTQFEFRSLSPFFPALRRGGDQYIMNPRIYFTAIGFAYFVATDVSFSLGIAPFVYAVVRGKFAEYGVPLGGGGHISQKIEGFVYGGSHFGLFLAIVYTGRRYFSSVFRRSLGLASADEVATSAVWGARVFLAGIALFMMGLVLVGLDWPWAVLYTGVTVVLFVVMSRVVAEAGTFFIHPYAYPGVLLWGFVGARALGPRNMLIMFIVTTVLVIDPREAVMPFAVHALKLAKGRGVALGRTAFLGTLALVLGLVVAVPVALYLQYDRGADATGDWWTRNDPKFSYDAVVKVQDRLSAQGHLEEAGKLGGLEWLRSVSPNWPGVAAFAIAAGLVLLLTAARLRFPRWPLHPVMLIVLTTWASRQLAVSFLIGCLVKVLVTKYGGASAYRKLRPVMIGIIAGDMLGGLIPMVIGAIYYFATGEPPKSFTVLPL